MIKRNPGPKRYAIYLRCSSDDQKEGDFTTVDVQRIACTKHIAERGGTLKEYTDEGMTGTNLKRKGWSQLLADAQAGLFDIVLVTYMSRLGRGDAYVIAEHELGKCKIKVEMVKEAFTNDISGHISKKMTNVMDGIYPVMVSGWTKTKQQEMVAQGYFCGSQPAFGYQTQIVTGMSVSANGKEPPKQLVLDPENAEIVRFCFDLFLQARKIAAVRNHLATITGGKWTTTKTKRLLTNEVYIGNYLFGAHRKDEAHPAIVDIETWQATQSILDAAANRRTSREPISDAYTYYLRGLVHCPHCNCFFTNSAAKGGAVRYYECLFHNKRKTICPVQRINADALHASVLREIKRAADHHTVMHRLIAESGGWQNVGDAQKSLRGQLSKLKQCLEMRTANFIKIIGDGGASPAILAALSKVEAQQKEVNQQLLQADQEIEMATIKRPTAKQVQESWSEIDELWEDVPEDERQELLASFVTQVEVKQKDRASMKLLPMPEGHGLKFVTKSQLGAGVGLEPTTFGL
ncbi:MAG: recombinase family protein [Janthinobacterium lividum]